MAWTTPPTATPTAQISSAMWNIFRDDLNATSVGQATSNGSHFAVVGLNNITQRTSKFDSVVTAEGTVSGSFIPLSTAGATVDIVCGSMAFVSISSQISNSTAGQAGRHGYEVLTATSIPPNDPVSVYATSASAGQSYQVGMTNLQTQLNPGNNVFASRYKNPGSGGTATFGNRRMSIFPL